jgi:CDP-4-dehydro-6-deoxyglucose reductase
MGESLPSGVTHRVRIEPAGQCFGTGAGEAVLDAALRQGIHLPYGCRNGSCGSCRSRVLSGQVCYPQGLPEGLSEMEAQAGFALLCQARAEADLAIEVPELAAVADIPVRSLPCRVERIERLAHDVVRLYLKLPEAERLRFLAGQYIEFLLKDGRRRAFSLANAPHDDRYLELHVRQVPGGGFTEEVFTRMQEKTILRIQGPLGGFFLREDSDRPIVFVAGGTGFAPVKGIIEHALARGIRRPMHLYWGARARRDLYLDDLARGWERDHGLRYVPVLSEPDPGDRWEGRTGLVHEAVLADFPDLSGHEVYTSGPPVMVAAVRDTLPRRGLPLAHLFSDAFEFARP